MCKIPDGNNIHTAQKYLQSLNIIHFSSKHALVAFMCHILYAKDGINTPSAKHLGF